MLRREIRILAMTSELKNRYLLVREAVVLHVRNFQPAIVAVALDKYNLVQDHIANCEGAGAYWCRLPQKELLLLLVVKVLEVAAGDSLFELF